MADIGDFEKMFAVITVMIQSVITFLLSQPLSIGQQFFFGGIYEVVKFSASAFIFGILFSTVRTHPESHLRDYPRFMINRWHVLFVPTILWTLTYLLIVPQLQQHLHYHNWSSFLWQFINGNAAPHLWYNTMMLQFIILMPCFWALAHWIDHQAQRALVVVIITTLFELGWQNLYRIQVFHGPHAHSWYLIDRFFPSFLIFAVAGTILWQFHQSITTFLMKHWVWQVLVWCLLLYYVTFNFFSFGLPVKVSNAPYYLPSMIFYNLSTIGLIVTFAAYIQKYSNQWLPFVHWVALYAYRSYLSHVFWLYWWWRLIQPWHLSVVILFPLLILLTVGTSFLSARLFHEIWRRCKQLFHWHPLIND